MRQPGRPRALDDTKRQIICAIIASGGTLDGAARYVGCAPSTLKREKRRNQEFREQLESAEILGATLPFQLMRDASGSSWRAAAWMLEKCYPDRYARPPVPSGKRTALQRQLDLWDRLIARLEQQFAAQKPRGAPQAPAETPAQCEENA